MWTLERTQTHPLPSSCVTPQLTLWTSSASWVQSSPRTSSGSWTSTKKAQKRMYCLRQQGTFNLPKKMMVRYKAESPTDTDSYTPIYLHYINALPSSVQFSYLFSLLTYFFFFFFFCCLGTWLPVSSVLKSAELLRPLVNAAAWTQSKLEATYATFDKLVPDSDQSKQTIGVKTPSDTHIYNFVHDNDILQRWMTSSWPQGSNWECLPILN